MANLKLKGLFSLGFISGCFFLGVGMGVIIRFGELQSSSAVNTSTEQQLPFAIPNHEQTSADTITI